MHGEQLGARKTDGRKYLSVRLRPQKCCFFGCLESDSELEERVNFHEFPFEP